MRMAWAGVVMTIACGGGGGGDPIEGPGGGGLPASARWAVGFYFAPQRVSDDFDSPAQGLIFAEDGTWTHSTDGSVDDGGAWSSPGRGTIELDNGETLTTAENCRYFDYQGRTYTRDEVVADCPVDPLTALEYCMVGEFEQHSDYGYYTVTTYHEDRTYRWDFYSADSSLGKSHSWWIADRQLFTSEAPESGIALDAETWAELTAGRTTPVDPRCDDSALTGGSGGGDDCDLTCSAGYQCAEFEGVETCCSSMYPHACPGLHWCYGDPADRDAECLSSPYRDPDFGCNDGELAIGLEGYSLCAPICDGTWCPDAPDGRAVGCDGALDDGTQVCMVLCSDVGVTGGTCPGLTTCVALPGGDGVCLW